MQYQSPNISSISSPSTSFISPRASPMLAEQIDPLSSHTNNNPSTPYDFQSQQASLTHQQHPQSQEQTPHKNSNADGGAPPKQVALAMERLGQAGKLVAQTRICSDRFVEALYKAYADKSSDPSSTKFMQVLAAEDLKMRGYLDELRGLGRTLEASGVMIGALQKLQETPGWGLHMPLVCPDGAVVAYAWKRQLAGQAAASAVDRTRLALKAFTDQKKRFFPHLEKDDGMPPAKRSCLSFGTKEDFRDGQSKEEQPADLLNVIKKMERETPTMKISAYSRLEWFKKISPQPPSRHNACLQKSPKLETHSEENSAVFRDVGVLDISVPSVFRAVISLTPAGSAIPDAVAFFSSEEVGSHMYARGSSKHNVFTQVSKFADKALQCFLHVNPHSALENLLRWIYTYQSLFTKACSKCGQIVAMDRISAVLLPPVIRPYQQSNSQRTVLTQPTPVIKHQSMDEGLAFHLGCSSEDET